MPSSVLGVEIAELNLSVLSSLSPSVWICTSTSTSTSSCLFYLTAGRLGSSGRSDACRPTFPLLFNSSVSGLFLITWARCALGWEKTPGGGWGPGSDFIELDISLLAFCHVFLLGFWKSLFFLVALQMTLLTWERSALVVPSVCISGLQTCLLAPTGRIRVTSGPSAHVGTCGCMVSPNNSSIICELW